VRAPSARQRTLHNAIAWSYNLLSREEQDLFACLSVFSGGFTLEAAEPIFCHIVTEKSVADLITSLLDKSLLQRTFDHEARAEPRFTMLVTIQQFALDCLRRIEKEAETRDWHQEYFLALAEQAAPQLKSAQQLEWFERLEAEHDNLRAALQWTQEDGDSETILRLAGALFLFWCLHSYSSEGRIWLERALAAEPALTSAARARALHQVAYLARLQGDFTGARELVEQSILLWRMSDSEDKQGLPLALALLASLARDGGDPATARFLAEESVALAREQGNAWNLASSLISLGMAIRDQEDYDLAQSTITESVAIWQKLGDVWGLAEALHHLGLVAYRRGDYQAAYSLMEEVLSIRRQLGDKPGIAYSIHNLGIFTLAQGDIERARPFFEQDLALFREVGDKSGIVLSLQYQGLFARLQGDDVQAQSFLVEGLRLAHETGPVWTSSNYLLWLADLAAQRGQFQRAVRLCSAANTHLNAVASYWDAFERSHLERILTLARASLGEDAFTLAQTEGRAMTIEQAIARALENQE